LNVLCLLLLKLAQMSFGLGGVFTVVLETAHDRALMADPLSALKYAPSGFLRFHVHKSETRTPCVKFIFLGARRP
jgi:hypothetical protein